MGYLITLSNVVSGRVKPDDIIDYDFERPKFGFYWWFWKPTFQTNGGKFKKKQVVDISLQWLCFSMGLIFWPNNSWLETFRHAKPKQ